METKSQLNRPVTSKNGAKKTELLSSRIGPAGPVGLVGKAMEAWGRGGATPVYDEVEIWDANGQSERPKDVGPAGKLSLTWGKLKAL